MTKCEENKPYNGNIKTRTQEKIDECNKQRAKEKLEKRSYNLKEEAIGCMSWFSSFLILFLFHYPKFRKINETEELK